MPKLKRAFYNIYNVKERLEIYSGNLRTFSKIFKSWTVLIFIGFYRGRTKR